MFIFMLLLLNKILTQQTQQNNNQTNLTIPNYTPSPHDY